MKAYRGQCGPGADGAAGDHRAVDADVVGGPGGDAFSGNFWPGGPMKVHAYEASATTVRAGANGKIDIL